LLFVRLAIRECFSTDSEHNSHNNIKSLKENEVLIEDFPVDCIITGITYVDASK